MRRRPILGGMLSFEFVFVLFITSGIYKATPLFDWFPLDVTLVTGALTVLAGAVVLGPSTGVNPYAVGTGVLVVLWFGWTALTLAWTTAPEAAQARALFGIPLTLLSFAGAAFIVARSEERITRFLRLFAWFGLVLVVITFYIVVAPGVQSATVKSNYIPRGIALAIAAVVMFTDAMAAGRQRWYRVVAVGLGLLYTSAVLAAGSRQALGALVLAIPLLVGFGWRASAGHRLVALACGFAVAVGGAVALYRFADDFRTLQRLELVLSGRLGTSLSIRSSHLQSAFGEFGDAPFLGHGLAAFGQLYGLSATDYPHNVVAEVLFESGLIGFGLFLAVVGALLLPVVRGGRTLDPFIRCVVTSAIAIVGVNAMVSGTFTENRLLWGIAGLAMVMAISEREARPWPR